MKPSRAVQLIASHNPQGCDHGSHEECLTHVQLLARSAMEEEREEVAWPLPTALPLCYCGLSARDHLAGQGCTPGYRAHR